jgi:hypothetical protein
MNTLYLLHNQNITIMLKKIALLIAVIGYFSIAEAQIKTPQPSPLAKTEQVVGLTNVTIEYSRPAMRGRTIFGDLVPFNALWRTGANANSLITFSDNVTIDGKELKKGTYSIYTIPNKESWEIMFYTDTNNWGNPQKWDDSKVALKTTAAVTQLPVTLESFSIMLNDLTDNSAVLGFGWENTYVAVTFEVPTDAIASQSIARVLAGPSKGDLYQAATYYHTSGKDLKQALEWMKTATEGDNPPFWYLRRMSLIQADMGDKSGAIATAKRSLEAAEKANNADYVKMNKESIAQWQQ